MITMSDEDDNEELPMIFFNSSAPDESRFSMPSAEQVATQRARERECERQLQELRRRHAADDAPPALARADSSGSEGEAALAAAVHHLRVAAPPPRTPEPTAAELLLALAKGLPPHPRQLLEHPDTALRLPEMVRSVGALVSGEGALADDEALTAGALLTAAVLAPDARPRAAARRALHALLDYCASREQALELCRVVMGAMPCRTHAQARMCLELSDALRSGAGGGADVAAARVRDAALTALLGAADASAEALADAAPRWRSLAPAPRYTALQLLGRRLAAGADDERGARARLLAALAPSAREHDAQRPDQLKVLVGASRLRLLFRSES